MLEHIAKAAITVVVAVLLAIGLILMAEGQAPPHLLQPSEFDARLDELDRRAIEQAYMAHVGLLFSNWVKDMETQQPARALKGLDNVRAVYIDSMTAVNARAAKR